MFAFLKKRRELQDARTKIGIDLHRQIKDALKSDDLRATERLSSPFTVGYVYSFVRHSLFSLGLCTEKDLKSHIRFICNGVIPGKLYKIYSSQAAALSLARGMKDKNREVLHSGVSPADALETFALGARAGSDDAPLVSLQPTPPDGLRRYLLNEPARP